MFWEKFADPAVPQADFEDMKMLYMIGSGIGGYLGWYLGAMVGEFFIPMLISGIGSIVGIILVWKLQRHFA